MKDPASALGERVANRLIADEDWAREKMRAHAGRAFMLRSGPIATAFLIRIDGSLDALSARGTTADAELSISPLDVPAFLAHPERWDQLVTTTGDDRLLATLRELAVTVPWFVERGFASVFGPVIGQRLADTGRALLGFPEVAGTRLADNVVSFARDEAGVLARGDEARSFAADSGLLGARVESLSERIERLDALLAAREDPPPIA
jgi:ubiquinone biosynthesis accessory factor UbiJ